MQKLWSADPAAPAPRPRREHVLPTGGMHIAFRLSGGPVRLYLDSGDAAGQELGFAVVGGVRACYYVKDIAQPACSIGAQLQPGAARLLLGAPAGELAGRHWQLGDLWGRPADTILEQLMEEADPMRRLQIFESFLISRLPRLRCLHPAVALGLKRLAESAEVGEVVRESGYSHHRFIALFQETVGLTPKLYGRLQRFQRALHLAADAGRSWVELALEAGYSDQAHFNREFLEFSGLSPGHYRRMSPSLPHHVPLFQHSSC